MRSPETVKHHAERAPPTALHITPSWAEYRSWRALHKRYVAEELAAAGVTVHLAEPADTALPAAASGTPRPTRPPGRAAAGRHRAGGDRAPWRPGCTSCGTGCWMPPGTWPEGPGRAAVRGRAGHRAGDDLLARRGGPVLLLRKAVRFAGLDVTVCSSDRKGPPGGLSRQGPPGRAGRCTRPARPTPGPRPRTTRYYAQAKDRCNGKRAALSEARKILRQASHILAELGDDALAAAETPHAMREVSTA